MKLLAENMLRFGIKNLNESDINNILQIISEQNEDLTDWSEGGKKSWENAKLSLIIKFVKEVDAKSGGAFLNMPEYQAMMEWFSKNDSKGTRASLKAWVFDNIVFSGKQPKVKKKDQQEDLGTISQALTSLLTWAGTKYYQNPKNAELLKSYITKLQQEISAYNKKGLSFTNTDTVRDFILNIRIIVKDLTLLYKTAQSKSKKLDQVTSDDTEDGTEYYNSFNEVLQYFNEYLKDGGFATDFDISTDGGDVKVDLTKTGANLSQIKTNVISSLRKSVVDAEGQKALDNFANALRSAKSILITNQMSEIKAGWTEYTKITQEAVLSDVTSPVFCYPASSVPAGAERDAMGQSMFGDNSITITDEARTSLNEQIQQAAAFIQEYKQKVEAIKNQVQGEVPDMEIISFQYSAYSSTSTVNTTYGDKRGRSNKNNNIKLATDRYNAMVTSMKELIEENDVLSEFDVEGPSEQYVLPNVGPEWMSVGGKMPNGQEVKIENYGPLFQQAYARNSNITPQQFYGLRSTPQLKEEYESVYAKFRQSTCAFVIQLRIPEVLAKQELIQSFVVGGTPEMLIDVDFPAGVDWTGMKRDMKRGLRKVKKGLSNIGGGRSGSAPRPAFKGRTTNCPIWN
jgi:hypothetical protein